MNGEVPEELLDPETPAEVDIRLEARAPVEDPTLGASVEVTASGSPRHRLVAIGDSLTHGFQSGAIYNTDLSYPAIIAYEMGWLDWFRRPHYNGFGGVPLNIEFLVRELEHRFGTSIGGAELALAAFHARHWLDQVEDWWERGGGSKVPNVTSINHDLGIYGWDLRDVLSLTVGEMRLRWTRPKDNLLQQIVENANEIAAIRVLARGEDRDDDMTPLVAARALGNEGTFETPESGDGIETLIVLLGSNNALSTVTQLRVAWTGDDYADLDAKRRYNVWKPSHFAAEFDLLAAEVKAIRARHVVFGTVPHVTIAPVARGVGTKIGPGSRYFPYYTRPWISDADFDPLQDPYLTHQQARAIDSAIDQYNDHIVSRVLGARKAGRDWYVLDVAGILDRLASRRYLLDPTARPAWWTPYELPPEIAALTPVPDSRFFSSDETGRLAGGLFSLDGVHPTTIAYGILAQEFIRVMEMAGVTFLAASGAVRTAGVRVDFSRLIGLDSLISSPPLSLSSDLRLIGWLDERLDILRRLIAPRASPTG